MHTSRSMHAVHSSTENPNDPYACTEDDGHLLVRLGVRVGRAALGVDDDGAVHGGVMYSGPSNYGFCGWSTPCQWRVMFLLPVRA